MIGIVILNYNNWQDTERCIRSIEQYPPQEAFHIYCVDNASTQKPGMWIREHETSQNMTFLYNDRNLGYAAGNNVGIMAARDAGCEYILITNNDVIFTEHAIAGMSGYLRNHPEVGILGPKIVNQDGRTQAANMCMRTGMREKYLLRTRFHILFPKYNSRYWGLDHDYEKECFQVHAVSGCCFMISAACAKDVTPLDEGTFLYEEEFILGIQMERAGWKTMYVPQYVVQHLHGASTRHVKVFAYTCNVQSEIYYCKKYLNASRGSILGLYCYRVFIYLVHCLKLKEYRKGLGKFLLDTYCRI